MSEGKQLRRALRRPSLRPWVIVCAVVCLMAVVRFNGKLRREIPVSYGDHLRPADTAQLQRGLEVVANPLAGSRGWTVAMIRIQSEMGSAAVPILLERAQESPMAQQRFALECLGMLGDVRALPVLLEQLGHEEQLVVRSAAVGLGDLGAPEGIDPLLNLLAHSESDLVQASAAESLGYLDLNDTQLAALATHAEHPNAKIQRAVRAALERQR